MAAQSGEEQEALSISLGAKASRLVLCPWDVVAADAGVSRRTTGFRGFTLSCILDSANGVTDPSGYLWKVASSKRRPRIARTIGVVDMQRAKEFYKDGLGLLVKKDYRKFVMFSGADGTSDLGMYEREALADDAAVDPDGSGFRGFSITHVVDSASRVDALLARAARAGGSIVKAALPAGRGGYSGYFADPDGNLWRVVSRG